MIWSVADKSRKSMAIRMGWGRRVDEGRRRKATDKVVRGGRADMHFPSGLTVECLPMQQFAVQT